MSRRHEARKVPQARSHQKKSMSVRTRVLVIGGLLAVAGTALVAQAAWLQLVDSEQYQEKGNRRFQRDLEIAATRGMITDRNGEPLAVSTPVESIWANPRELAGNAAGIRRLAEALELDPAQLSREITAKADKQFHWVKRRMNPALAQEVMALGIAGVYSQREFRRFYPQGEAFAHVLGFTNVDDHGQGGVELALDAELRGKPGQKRLIRDNRGRFVEHVELLRAAVPGKDVVLSLDRRIQYLAYRELGKMIEESGAAAGSAVVLDVRSGEVLAMANLPSFNPNNLTLNSDEVRRNRALTDPLEPGSTIKPLTVAAGLEAGVIQANSTFNTSPGWIANGKYRTTDTRNYGILNTTGLIQKSSNVGMALIVRRLENRQFHDFLQRFGYGQRTGLGLPGESPGLLPSPARWDGTSKQTMSYGYGFNATPMQIAHAYATLGNGGVAVQPTFIRGHQGERRQVLDAQIARTVVQMMQTVTEPGGTATQAAILGYHVAGKTGTARKASGGGYSRRYVAYFAGLVPVEAPRYAMVVAVDDPDPAKKGYYGGLLAAPVFRNVMEGTLRLMDVPPDDIETWIAAQAKRPDAPAVASGAVVQPLPQALPQPLPEPLEARQ